MLDRLVNRYPPGRLPVKSKRENTLVEGISQAKRFFSERFVHLKAHILGANSTAGLIIHP
ncbi:MAG: hypothetical protein ACE5GA_04945 [Candidatus Zixiibacteriota bacterium]